MKAYEVSKGEADIPRGRVMMAIEGTEAALEAMAEMLRREGYPSTQCSDVGDKDGEIIEYFMISRTNKADFMATYKLHK